jgi:hypothetical protein
MHLRFSTLLPAAICGWLFLSSAATAQLVPEWNYNFSTLGRYAYIDHPVIVDDSGNAFVLSYAGYNHEGARVTKLRPDSTIAWQVNYPDSGLGLNYFGRSPAGDLYIFGHHEILGGHDVSVVGIKINADGTLAWGRVLTAQLAPYASYPRGAVDFDGNLWIGFTETPVDSFCIDSLPDGSGNPGESGVISHGVIYRLDSQSGTPTLVERVTGEDRQLTGIWNVSADNDGFVNVGIYVAEFCCNSLCQNCRDSCFTNIVFGNVGYRSTYYLRRYTTGGSFSGSTWVAASDNSIFSAYVFSGRMGELLIFKHQFMSPQPYWSHVERSGRWATSFPGETNVSSMYAPTTDYSGNVLLWHWLVSTKAALDDSERETMVLDAATGAVKWTKPGIAGYMGADRNGNVYVNDRVAVHKFDQSGAEQWACTTGVDLGSILHADTAGWFYFQNYTTLARYNGTKYITIRDARRDSLPNVTFDLIRVSNNPPYFDEDTLGSFTADDRGRLSLIPLAPDSFFAQLDLTGDTLVIGDSLKIARHVHSEPAIKHEALLGTMYSVHLDNAKFAENGHLFFDTLTSGNQDIVLNHAELRYNLLVSLEWEATDAYLWSLEDNFRYMSNYLYDVSDGQIRLDTVYIFDNNDFYAEADLLILASNMEWPRAHAGGILRNGIDYLYMPRIWMGDSTRTRNHTDAVYPLDLTHPSHDYRTKVHEFGHYALNFFDEYLFWHPDSNLYSPNNSLRCLPPTVFRYGFMDSQYEDGGGISSEMSGTFRYNMESCRNTNQWRVHGKSCWEHLESWVEAVPWGAHNLFVPILKPDLLDTLERVVTNPAVFFSGPNNDLNNPDYDVGLMIHFPNQVLPQATGYSNKHVTVHHSSGGDNADIRLWNNPNAGAPLERVIQQGRSSDASGAWVVGVKDAAYQILASKGNSLGTVTPSPSFASSQNLTTGWLYGMAESGGSGVSKVGNRFSASRADDSLTIELNEVKGNYPLIIRAILIAEGVNCDFTAAQSFPSDPSLDLWPSYGGSYSQSISLSASGYSSTVSDSLGISGSFTLWAVDDSSKAFFVPSRYTITGVSHSQSFIWLFGAEGQSEFKLDSTNVSLTKTIILSSPYPVIRTGLDENAVQAGQAHCLSVFPDEQLTGANQVVIRYDDADLRLGEQAQGDETSLAIYLWVDDVTGWQPLGGAVDIIKNEVYAPIEQTGLYAAFTTQIVTDVEDDQSGDILPYHFELSQNYPNPFNPITTIKYSLPKRNRVTIEVYNALGQKVRTLVNREESAGSYTITWDGTNASGKSVSTGVYLYRFQAGNHIESKKMLLLR